MPPKEKMWLKGLLKPLRHPNAGDDDDQERRKLHFDALPLKGVSFWSNEGVGLSSSNLDFALAPCALSICILVTVLSTPLVIFPSCGSPRGCHHVVVFASGLP